MHQRTYNLRDGLVTLKPGVSTAIIRYIDFLITHHNYDAKKFQEAKGTELFKYIEHITLKENSNDQSNGRSKS